MIEKNLNFIDLQDLPNTLLIELVILFAPVDKNTFHFIEKLSFVPKSYSK